MSNVPRISHLRPFCRVAVVAAAALFSAPAFAATFTVDAFDEAVAGYDGNCATDCTLRDAIALSNANGVDDTIIVPSGSPDIILVIAGTGEDANATGDHDIWDTAAGTTLTIQLNGTRVANQSGASDRIFHTLPTGGGVHAVTLIVEDGEVLSGEVIDAPGGCVLAEEAPIELDGVTFSQCHADWSAAATIGGGAVAALGGATITDSAFSNNRATLADGGALYVLGDLSVTQSTFADNAVVGATGRGGSVRWLGSSQTANLTDVVVERSASPTNGGGLSLSDTAGIVRLTRVDLDENETGGNGANLFSDVDDLAAEELIATEGAAANRGGGWYMIPGTGATGQYGQGGTPICDRCAFTGNEAGTEGGGVAIHVRAGAPSGTFIFRNTTIGENVSGTATGGTNPGAGLWLAAGAVGGSGSSFPAVTALLQHSSVVNNDSAGAPDKDLHVQSSSLTIAMENSIVDGPCEATIPPPGIYVSLGGNVLWTQVGAQNCPVTVTDTNPAGSGASVFTLGPATLITSPTPHYDNADAPASIDFVTCPSAVAVDQLSTVRPTTPGTCDSGSIEQ